MVRKGKKIVVLALLLVGLSVFVSARPDDDSSEDRFVRLIKAKSVKIISDESGKTFREAVEATFLHNNTYLVCDTAYWRVDDNIINAIGNVCLSQEGTKLTSQKLDYFVDDNLAQFRGGVVQLLDKENNTLRTHFLDYNTADSVAVFSRGASMKDKDGQIIESIDGTYSSKDKLFSFEKNVNMFTDSVFIKTNALDYHTDTQKAIFKTDIDFWKDGNMLSAGNGWYSRQSELFFFTKRVHATTKGQETWCDSLYFYKIPNNVLMRGSVQLQDTLHNTCAVSKYMFYVDSISTITLRDEAAVAIMTETEANKRDTLYFGADTLVYYTLRYCDIPTSELSASQSRKDEIMTDPVGEYRKKAAEAAAAAAAEAKEKAAGTRPGLRPDDTKKKMAGDALPPDGVSAEPDVAPVADSPKLSDEKGITDSLSIDAPNFRGAAPKDSLGKAVPDTLGMVASVVPLGAAVADSLGTALLDSLGTAVADSLGMAVTDSIPPVLDTTKVGFAYALGNVKIFRKDIQVRCDSMRYSDLDSIARFYKDPVIWNEERRQYYSDSLALLVKGNSIDRASLMSNAFVVTKEDEKLYDQIRGAEIMAYFDSTSALRRFDALGDAVAIFYLDENGHLATVNKVESKMLSGNFVEGKMDRIYYYDSPKNDAYPVVQFPEADRLLKGFKWTPERRPEGKQDITTLTLRPSERSKYEAKPRAEFRQTDIYFPGYIKSVYDSIDAREKAAALAEKDKKSAPLDSLPLKKDSLKVSMDSLSVHKDSLSVGRDSLSVALDSLKSETAAKDSVVVQSARKTVFDKIGEWIDQLRARREARWARLDERDAKREALKKEKALKKKREKTRKELIEKQKQEQKEKEILDKYIQYYEKQKQNGKVSR